MLYNCPEKMKKKCKNYDETMEGHCAKGESAEEVEKCDRFARRIETKSLEKGEVKMITTYEKYSRLRDLGLVIDRGLVNDNDTMYHCYDRLDTQETCHYSVAERDEDLTTVQAIFI